MQPFDRNIRGALRLKARMAAIALAFGMSVAPVALAEDAAAPAVDPLAAPADPMAAVDPMAASAAPMDAGLPASDAAAAPAAGEEAAVAEAETTQESVENPYGLAAMWEHGDWVSKGLLIILVTMSIASWYIMVVRLIDQGTMLKHARNTAQNFWDSKDLHQGLQTLEPTSAFRSVLEAGLKAADSNTAGLRGKIDVTAAINYEMTRAVGEATKKMQAGLPFLATVGSVTPFIGLLGTVWGIYHALIAIGISGQASIDKVAGPVGEALIMTAIGLAVAVPAVLGYNGLLSRNKQALDQLRNFSADVEQVLLTRGH